MIQDNQNGTFTVKTASGNTFNIVESDSHTQSMLTDFLNTPECLTEFEQLLDADSQTAYRKYNKISEPIVKTAEEQREEELQQKANDFDEAMKAGDFKNAYLILNG